MLDLAGKKAQIALHRPEVVLAGIALVGVVDFAGHVPSLSLSAA